MAAPTGFSDMNIGSIKLQTNILNAPMAGISDLPYRLFCRQMGAGLVVTEMVSAKALVFGDAKTKFLLCSHPAERPVAVQIFGREPDIMARAAEILAAYDFDIIDINMCCPAPKIVRNGEGAAIMQNPPLVGEIVRAVVGAAGVPVTVKLRKGWTNAQTNAAEVAKIAEDAGAAAITIHGRTRDQFFEGVADWDIIAKIKQAVKIPVIGNGDVDSGEKATKMFEQTNCDAIMIGRAANGNPWIFREIIHYLKTGQHIPKPSLREKIDFAMNHAREMIRHKGEHTGLREMRKHFCWYIKGERGANRARAAIVRAESLLEIEGILNDM